MTTSYYLSFFILLEIQHINNLRQESCLYGKYNIQIRSKCICHLQKITIQNPNLSNS